MAQRMLDIVNAKSKRKADRISKKIIIDLTDDGDEEKMAELLRLKKWEAMKKKEKKAKILREEIQSQARKNQIIVAEKTLLNLKRKLAEEQRQADVESKIKAAGIDARNKMAEKQRQAEAEGKIQAARIAARSKMVEEQSQAEAKIQAARIATCFKMADERLQFSQKQAIIVTPIAGLAFKKLSQTEIDDRDAAEFRERQRKRMAECKKIANDRHLANFRRRLAARITMPRMSIERRAKLEEIDRQRQLDDASHAKQREQHRIQDNAIILAKIEAKKRKEISDSIAQCSSSMIQHLTPPSEDAVAEEEEEDYDETEILFPFKVSALESHLFEQHEKIFVSNLEPSSFKNTLIPKE